MTETDGRKAWLRRVEDRMVEEIARGGVPKPEPDEYRAKIAEEAKRLTPSDPGADLYGRLLGKLIDPNWLPEDNCACFNCKPREALAALVELHKPQPCFWPCHLKHEHVICHACRPPANLLDPAPRYPCETVRVIAAALGVDDGVTGG